MPIARFQMPDGRIARFEVPEGTTPEEAQALMEAQVGGIEKQTPKGRSWGEAASDVGFGLLSGMGEMIKAPSQFYGAVTGDYSDTGVMKVGNELSETGRKNMSAHSKREQERRSKNIDDAMAKDGFLSAVKSAVVDTATSPSLLTSAATQMLPSMIPAIGATKAVSLAGKAAGMAAPTVAKLATGAGVLTGAGMQGVATGEATYRETYRAALANGASQEEAAAKALSLARAAGASSGVISALVQQLPGAKALLQRVAGAGSLGSKAPMGVLKAGLGGGVSEATDEASAVVLRNAAVRTEDSSRDIRKGVPEAIADAFFPGAAASGYGSRGNRHAYEAGIARKEQEEATKLAEDSAKAEAEAAAYRKTPEYLDDLQRRYQGLLDQRTAQREKKVAKPPENDPARMQAWEEAEAARKSQETPESEQTLIDEYKSSLADIDALVAARQEAAAKEAAPTKEEAPPRELPTTEQQRDLFDTTDTPGTRAPVTERFEQANTDVQFYQQQNTALLDAANAAAQRGNIVQANRLTAQAESAHQKVQTLTGEIASLRAQLPPDINALTKRWRSALEEGDATKALRLGTQLEELTQQMAGSAPEQTTKPTGTQTMTQPAAWKKSRSQSSESTDAFNARTYEPGEIGAVDNAVDGENPNRIFLEDSDRIEGYRQEGLTEAEIAQMERKRLNTGRTDQQGLFTKTPREDVRGVRSKYNGVLGTERASERTSDVEASLTPSTTTPAAFRAQLDSALANRKVDPEIHALLVRVADAAPAIEKGAAEGRALDDAAAWIHQAVAVGKDSPTLRKQVEAHLDALDSGKLSDTETPTRETAWGTATGVTAQKRQGDMFPDDSVQGTVFDSAAEFDRYLAGDGLAALKMARGDTTDTAARAARLAEPLKKRAEALRRQVEALQEQHAQTKARGLETDSALAQKEETTRTRLRLVQEHLRQQLQGVTDTYQQVTREALDAYDALAEVHATIETNVSQFHADLLPYIQKVQSAELAVQAGLRSDVTKNNFTELRQAQAELAEATRDLSNAAPSDSAIRRFLNADLRNQLELQERMNALAEVEHSVALAKLDLDATTAELTKAVAPKIAANKGVLTKLGNQRTANDAKTSTDLADIESSLRETDTPRRVLDAQADTITRATEKARDARVAPPAPETQSGRETKDANTRKAENDTQGALAAIPGRRVSFEGRRRMLEAFSGHNSEVAALERTSKDTALSEGERGAAQAKLDKIRDDAMDLYARASLTPEKTLGGLRSDVTKLEKALVAAESEGRVSPEMRQAQASLTRVETRYKKAKTSEQRAALEDKVQEAQRIVSEMQQTAPRLSDEQLTLGRQLDAARQRVDAFEDLLAARRDDTLQGEPDETAVAADKTPAYQAYTKKMASVEKLRGKVNEDGITQRQQASRKKVLVEAERQLEVLRLRMEKADSRAMAGRGIKETPIETPALRAERLAEEGQERSEQRTEAQARGQDAQELPARKVGPLVKKALMAGEMKTGSAESKAGDNKTSGANKVQQGGTPRSTLTASRAAKEGSKISAERNAQDRLAHIEDMREANEARLEHAREAEDAELIAKHEAYAERIEAAYEAELSSLPEGVKNLATMDEGGNALFRTSTDGKGQDRAAVEHLTARITQEWKNLPPIETVQSESELPARLQAQMDRDGQRGKAPGMYDPATGTVYMVADNLHSANDVALTIAHEVAGHFGLRSMLGADYARTMKALYDGNSSLRAKADALRKGNERLSFEHAVEEVLADMAESGPAAANGIAKAFYAVKQWLYKTLGLKGVTDGEVGQIVANARKHVQDGTTPPKGEKRTERVEPTMGEVALYRTNNAMEQFGADLTQERSVVKDLLKYKSKIPLALEQAGVDMRASLRQTFAMTKTGTQAAGSIISADRMMNNTMAVAGGGAMRLVAVEKGHFVLKAGGSKSLVDVSKAVAAIPGKYTGEEKFNLVQGYLTAMRASKVGWQRLSAADPAAKQAAGEAALKAVNADPALKAALERVVDVYHDLNRGMLQGLKDTHALSPADADRMMKDRYYTPFYRDHKDGVDLVMDNGKMVSIGDIRSLPFLHALKGGDEKLMPFEKAMFKNAAMLTNLMAQNVANTHIAYHLQELGNNKTMQIRRGQGPKGDDILRFKAKPDPRMPQDTGDRWVQIDTTGTAAEHIPNALLVRAVAGSYATIPAWLKLAASFSDALRSGVTRMPTYLVSQLYKDSVNASVLGNIEATPVSAVVKTVNRFIKDQIKQSATGKSLSDMGVLHSQTLNGDPSDMPKLMMQIAGNNQSTYRRIIAQLDSLAMSADAAVREQGYEDVRKKGGSELEAMIHATEMQNFNKRGGSVGVQMIARLIPFFNAQIQGMNVLAKAATGNMPSEKLLKTKEKFFNRAMGMAALSVMFAAQMDDDPEWVDTPMSRKLSHIPIPGVKIDGHQLGLPSPFESGVIAWGIPVAFVQALKGHFSSPADWKAVKHVLIGQIPGGGSLMPQAAKGVYGVSTNHDAWFDAPIETDAMQRVGKTQRFNASTSEAAKRFSERLVAMGVPLSPIQIEFLAKSYLGELPHIVAAMTNQLFDTGAVDKGAAREKDASENPFYGRFLAKTNQSKVITDSYDRANEARMIEPTAASIQKEKGAEAARAYRKEALKKYGTPQQAAAFTTYLGALRKQMARVETSKELSGAEKATKRAELQRKMAERARTYYAGAEQ